MPRIYLKIAYDGTNYAGWQMQKNALGVETVINQALLKLTGEEIVIIGASRTDSGVHALGNVAVFDTCSTIPPKRFSYALNSLLPMDIRILESKEVPKEFHPRYTKEIRKTYEYRIDNSKLENPLRRLYSYHVHVDLDDHKMNEACKYLLGTHDFASFCAAHTQVKTTERTIYQAEVVRQGDQLIFRIQGNGFLYNMVRLITGTLLRVGRGFYEPIKVKEILEKRNRELSGPNVPPQGLILVEILYGNLEKENKL